MIVVRIDESTLAADGTTLFADLAFLVERGQRPIVVAPSAEAARTIVKTINRTSDAAVGVSGADAGMLPASGERLGSVQTRLLHTLLSAGYIPVVEPLAFGMFGGDVEVHADDVASAVAR
jgi:acetylglutamate kinase